MLSLTSNSQKPQSKVRGTYVDIVQIASISVVYSEIPTARQRFTEAQPSDIVLKMELEIGRDFKPGFEIFGNFKRNTERGIVDWGGAFPIRDFLNAAGFDGTVDDNGQLDNEKLQTLVGKSFKRLTYVSHTKKNGKVGYTSWNLTTSPTEADDVLFDKFLASLTKGFPRNFHPELLERDQTNFSVAELLGKEAEQLDLVPVEDL
jgi:hypothetical protein